MRQRVAACLVGGALVLATLAGCAPTPVPSEALTAAELAVTRARAAGAEQDAARQLANAEEKLQAARAAVRVHAHDRARALAEQALADAELAEGEAQAAQAQAAAKGRRGRVDPAVSPGGAGCPWCPNPG